MSSDTSEGGEKFSRSSPGPFGAPRFRGFAVQKFRGAEVDWSDDTLALKIKLSVKPRSEFVTLSLRVTGFALRELETRNPDTRNGC